MSEINQVTQGSNEVLPRLDTDQNNPAQKTVDLTSLDNLEKIDDGSFADKLVSLFRSPPPRKLDADINEEGNVVVSTADGYQLRFEGKNMEWHIIHPDGQKTVIWGDPHVVESDGGKWDFYNQSSFVFGENKATVKVAPWGNSGATVTKEVTIYAGNERFTITDLDINKPRFVAWDERGESHDKLTKDGDVFKLLKGNGEEWQKL